LYLYSSSIGYGNHRFYSSPLTVDILSKPGNIVQLSCTEQSVNLHKMRAAMNDQQCSTYVIACPTTEAKFVYLIASESFQDAP